MEEVVKKTSAKKTTPTRKVAPSVIVNSHTKKTSIDELYADNPNKDFVYAAAGTSASALSNQGLTPVIGKDGGHMVIGGRVICEDTGTVCKEETARAHKAATNRIAEVKDPKQANSADKTAVAKKPAS